MQIGTIILHSTSGQISAYFWVFQPILAGIRFWLKKKKRNPFFLLLVSSSSFLFILKFFYSVGFGPANLPLPFLFVWDFSLFFLLFNFNFLTFFLNIFYLMIEIESIASSRLISIHLCCTGNVFVSLLTLA